MIAYRQISIPIVSNNTGKTYKAGKRGECNSDYITINSISNDVFILVGGEWSEGIQNNSVKINGHTSGLIFVQIRYHIQSILFKNVMRNSVVIHI